mmetsp:Transcript_28614/g.80669  ORF Transcript_28614/g.80669 Transcript_28614/m.80669 type:complete len:206 (+) Transcript_28614:3323-3940(+)
MRRPPRVVEGEALLGGLRGGDAVERHSVEEGGGGAHGSSGGPAAIRLVVVLRELAVVARPRAVVGDLVAVHRVGAGHLHLPQDLVGQRLRDGQFLDFDGKVVYEHGGRRRAVGVVVVLDLRGTAGALAGVGGALGLLLDPGLHARQAEDVVAGGGDHGVVVRSQHAAQLAHERRVVLGIRQHVVQLERHGCGCVLREFVCMYICA